MLAKYPINSLWMYTMNRCTALPLSPPKLRITPKNIAARAAFPWAKALFVLNLTILAATPAIAEEGVVLSAPEGGAVAGDFVGRQFPPAARRGTLEVLQGAEVILDGKAERLSPGARIRGVNNMLVMSGGMVGQRYVVNFTRDAFGNVHQVWLLTAQEAAQKIKTATPERNFVFGSEANQPKTDDGKTAFKDLPKFKQ